MDLNLEHDINVVNRRLDEIKSKIDEAIELYSTCKIDAKSFESILWDIHFELNSLSRGNNFVFSGNKSLTQKLVKIYNRNFRYINHHDRLITPQKPLDSNNVDMI